MSRISRRTGADQPDPDRIVQTTIRVRYAEVDQMRVAYYANYLVWFEAARGALCRDRGIDYGAMETERGLFLPVVEAYVRYRTPARYDDELTISIYVKEATRRTIRFACQVHRGETLIADGETNHILMDRNGRACTFPPDLAAAFL